MVLNFAAPLGKESFVASSAQWLWSDRGQRCAVEQCKIQKKCFIVEPDKHQFAAGISQRQRIPSRSPSSGVELGSGMSEVGLQAAHRNLEHLDASYWSAESSVCENQFGFMWGNCVRLFQKHPSGNYLGLESPWRGHIREDWCLCLRRGLKIIWLFRLKLFSVILYMVN